MECLFSRSRLTCGLQQAMQYVAADR